MDGIERLSIVTMLGGAVIERIDDEIAKAIENVTDPSTAPTAKRSIRLDIDLKPEKDRSIGNASIAVTSKLAPTERMGTRLFISQTKAGPVATEYNPNQPMLPEVMATNNVTITPLRAVGGVN